MSGEAVPSEGPPASDVVPDSLGSRSLNPRDFLLTSRSATAPALSSAVLTYVALAEETRAALRAETQLNSNGSVDAEKVDRDLQTSTPGSFTLGAFSSSAPSALAGGVAMKSSGRVLEGGGIGDRLGASPSKPANTAPDLAASGTEFLPVGSEPSRGDGPGGRRASSSVQQADGPGRSQAEAAGARNAWLEAIALGGSVEGEATRRRESGSNRFATSDVFSRGRSSPSVLAISSSMGHDEGLFCGLWHACLSWFICGRAGRLERKRVVDEIKRCVSLRHPKVSVSLCSGVWG